jgi:prepilin-type N-terminal cleavage/methylation domain-containing protein
MTRYTTAGANGQAGFTLLEVLLVAGIIAVIAAMTVPVTDAFIRSTKSDSSVSAAVIAVDAARDRAVAERRNVVLNFVLPNRIQLIRQNIDSAGAVIGTTMVDEFLMENGLQIYKFPSAGDTPDGFGATSATSFSGTAPVMFTSDGSLVDSNGDVVNGTLFFGVPGQNTSARAVTIFGVTGFTRTWKWSGSVWRQ